MCRRLEYRVSRRAKYVIVRIERGVDDNGGQSGSFRLIGEYDTAADAERVRAALEVDGDSPATEPSEGG